MNLSKAVVLDRLPLDDQGRDVCHFDVVSVETDDFIFEALITMTRHNKRRLAVAVERRNMSACSRTSTFSAWSPAIRSSFPAGSTARARIDDLADPRARHPKPGRAPAPAGRQGRGDRRDHLRSQPPPVRQAVRPDRLAGHPRGRLPDGHGLGGPRRADRAHRPGQRPAAGARRCRRTSCRPSATTSPARSRRFGFPPCPGNVMVRNPQWSQPIDGFVRQIRGWVLTPDDEQRDESRHLLRRRARSRADRELLDRAKTAHDRDDARRERLSLPLRARDRSVRGRERRHADLDHGHGRRRLRTTIDIKKSGTFPIVHGVRTLAIDNGLTETPTVQRIEALDGQAACSATNSAAILPARCPISWRCALRSQLRAMKTGKREAEAIVRLGELTTRDRDLLRDALRVVKRFREVVRSRYHLERVLMGKRDVRRPLRRLIDRIASRATAAIAFLFRDRTTATRSSRSTARRPASTSVARRHRQHRGDPDPRLAHSRPARPSRRWCGPSAAMDARAIKVHQLREKRRGARPARSARCCPSSCTSSAAARWSATGSIFDVRMLNKYLLRAC